MVTVRSAVAAVAALALVAACGGDDDRTEASGSGATIEVVANFYPLAEAAVRVGGDQVEVTNLTPAGTEPHDLELTPDQVDDLEDADVVFYLGQGFQPAVAEIAGRRDAGAIDVLATLDLEAGASAALEADEHEEENDGEAAGGGVEEAGVGEEEGEGDEHAESGLDPHFWLDPQRMIQAIDLIEAELAAVAPDHAEAFAENAARYTDELAALDDRFEAALATCEHDEIVTSHAAFFYLADRYGLAQTPIAGLSPEAEPDAARIAELADRIEAEGITTVFYESLVSPEVAETLADEAGVRTAVLNPLEGLSEDQVEAGADYASVMDENLSALTEALGCN